ncbi:MAG: NAD+ synthase [Bacteroidetes bacterium]|nr:NAD+ synthase [Bacteroidota bacterium]MBU1114581.1 NAD+ synthase [Bacteroidota bacterium]MBU1799060.1 NAD+ synthase [Bacteroidota bacterium]
MKIALCQIDPIIGDLEWNKKKIIDGYNKAIESKVDLVIFPELTITGYPPQDLIERKVFRNAVTKATKEIASITKEVGLIFGTITEEFDTVGTGLYNSAVLCHDGKVQFTQHKTLLPNYDVFDEVRYFESAKEVYVYEFKGEKLGISICEDIWNDADYWKQRRYYRDPVQRLVEKGSTILINISASPYAFGRRQERFEMLSTLTKTNNLPLVYVCVTGAQTDLIFDGASMCFNSKGELELIGKKYDEDFFIYDTDKTYNPIIEVENSMEEEVLAALTYGLKEYAVKTGFSKALIGLSGGIDSALVTYIAVQALGKNNVHVVMMPSQYSSEGSIKDSEKLIANLGITSDKISIQPVFEKINEMIQPAFKGMPNDITEENMQARIRGLYLMSFANKFNYLLCTTGNKSEMSVGYATLYGDMNGALGVIADVYKTDVFKISKFINHNSEIIPNEIISKPPSAELRPDQKDEDSLPSYDLLDQILKMYLEEHKETEEIIAKIGNDEIVKKVLLLVDRSEFKRYQAAPPLRVSTKSFSYGRRVPIVQGWRK